MDKDKKPETDDTLGDEHDVDNMERKQQLNVTEGDKVQLMNTRRGCQGAVTRKKNEVIDLMENCENLGQVKNEMSVFEERYSNYKRAHQAYIAQLQDEDELEKEEEAFNQKRLSIVDFIRAANAWITRTEADLAESMDSASDRKSRRSQMSWHSTISRVSEKAKLSELLVEKEMLGRLQEAHAVQQNLKLEMKIEKAKARERAFSALDHNAPEFFPTGPSVELKRPIDRRQERTTSVTPEEFDGFNVQATRFNDDRGPGGDDANDDARSVTGNDLLAALTLPQPTLQKFDGKIEEYATFIKAFEARVASKLSVPADRLYYLYEHLQGGPRDLIEGCLVMEQAQGYREARKILDDEYGDTFKLSNVYISNLENWPVIKADDSVGLKQFALYLSKCLMVMNSVSYLNVLNHSPYMLCVVHKLPVYLQHRWRELASKSRIEQRKIVEFEDLARFVKSAAEASNDPVYGRQKTLVDDKRHNKNAKAKGKHRVISLATNVNTTVSCPLCNETHDLEECNDFQAKAIDERRLFLCNKRLCFACFGKGHMSKGCSSKRRCNKCKKPHPTSLHIDGYNPSSNPAQQSGVNGGAQPSSICAATEVHNSVLHAILPVKVSQGHTGTTVLTYAFYDNGSSGCFISDDLQEQLQAIGTPTVLQLKTMHGCSHSDSSVINNLIVSDLDGKNCVKLPKTYTRNEIPMSRSHIARPEDVANLEHLSHIADKIPKYMPRLDIGILIGSNCPLALEPLEICPGENNQPYAVRIRHGWTVHGPVVHGRQVPGVQAHKTAVKEVESFKELISPSCVLKMFERDFVELKEPQYPEQRGLSFEDQQFLKTAENGLQFMDGHYTLPLPLRKNVHLPNNRSYVLKRLMHQRNKMLKDPGYYNDYREFMGQLFEKGYAELANDSNSPDSSVWYLPHHGIYHPNKPRKIHVVFDCSATFAGISLNSCLLQGPDMTNSLVGVLSRFREKPVAFIGDIETMFYQVKVPPEQRRLLRFLWWPDGKLQATVKDYQMTVHLFGAVSSPSIANFALRKAALAASDSQVTNTILTNFYVDDCLKSMQTVPAAISHIAELRTTCMAGGFRLTKFVSNSSEVMQSIPEEEHAKELRKCDLASIDSLIEKALGIQWDIKSDQFNFYITIKDRPFTRRGILSMMSSVFDPLGFLGPVILPAKKLLQDLCREHRDWDEPISEEHQNSWRQWLASLHELEGLTVERCLTKTNTASVPVKRELHVFADGSIHGYGVVVYQVTTFEDGESHMSFIIGKSRLAPIKTITIPRLELTAAMTAVRMAEFMRHEMSEEMKVNYYTDSTTVLNYIANDKKRWPIFVANRVQTIREFTDPKQWKYVPSNQNPADDASRGLTARDLLNKSSWLTGPRFLLDPNGPDFKHDCNEEGKNDLDVNTTEPESDAVHKLMHYFSDWHCLKVAVATFSKIKRILRDRLHQKHDPLFPAAPVDHYSIKVTDLEQAEVSIFQWLHGHYFPQEISGLSGQNQRILKSSPLRSLDPFLENGVLRVGGRLRKANISSSAKHPVILPRKSHITTLVIRHIHKRLGHAGRNHVLSELRQRYWVIGANSAARNLIYQCVTCRKLRGPEVKQKMADLPDCRVNDGAPPFTCSGVDYFGPFMIRERRRDLKQYGVLFTCLASRAIHLEVAQSLDTDSFLHALRRFVARRGNVRALYSDNGTNFVGAEKELRMALSEMNHSQIQADLRHLDVDWNFNPPHASHMGGSWERLIRTVRKVLSGLLQEHGTCLDRESFHTLLCEVEAIVNSRPMTYPSGDVGDNAPLTPNHILTGRTQVTVPPPGIFDRSDLYVRRRWRRVQYLSNLFWSRWRNEFLLLQQRRQKWNQPLRNMKLGDVVIMRDDSAPRNLWPLGIVTAVEPDSTGYVRTVKVKTQHSEFKRPINKLVLLVAKNDG